MLNGANVYFLLKVRASMETVSLMRTSSWSTMALAGSAWPMLAKTPMAPSSSSPQFRLPGWTESTSFLEKFWREWWVSGPAGPGKEHIRCLCFVQNVSGAVAQGWLLFIYLLLNVFTQAEESARKKGRSVSSSLCGLHSFSFCRLATLVNSSAHNDNIIVMDMTTLNLNIVQRSAVACVGTHQSWCK